MVLRRAKGAELIIHWWWEDRSKDGLDPLSVVIMETPCFAFSDAFLHCAGAVAKLRMAAPIKDQAKALAAQRLARSTPSSLQTALRHRGTCRNRWRSTNEEPPPRRRHALPSVNQKKSGVAVTTRSSIHPCVALFLSFVLNVHSRCVPRAHSLTFHLPPIDDRFVHWTVLSTGNGDVGIRVGSTRLPCAADSYEKWKTHVWEEKSNTRARMDESRRNTWRSVESIWKRPSSRFNHPFSARFRPRLPSSRSSCARCALAFSGCHVLAVTAYLVGATRYLASPLKLVFLLFLPILHLVETLQSGFACLISRVDAQMVAASVTIGGSSSS